MRTEESGELKHFPTKMLPFFQELTCKKGPREIKSPRPFWVLKSPLNKHYFCGQIKNFLPVALELYSPTTSACKAWSNEISLV